MHMTWRVWTQYVPSARDQGIDESLTARLQDPLWLLNRQWQVGEFFGEDAGSPIRVEVETEFFPADACTLGGAAQPYTPEGTPLEALVEAEPPAEAAPDLRLRAHWGRLFLARLAEEGPDTGDLAERFGFGPDALAVAEGLDAAAALVVRRSPDAESLRLHFAEAPTTDAEIRDAFPGAAVDRLETLRTAIDRWLADYSAATGLGAEGAWRVERSEYGFAVGVPTDIGRVVLSAPEYHGGRLDWDAFEIAAIESGGAAAGTRERHEALASQVSYLGMPAPRFWEFEDAAVDFGDPGGGERDIGRLLLAEVALAWGNDWFQVPIDLPAGGLARVRELLVTDTFGITTRIPAQHRHSPTWTVQRLSRPEGLTAADDFLWLAPALPTSHESPPVETVLFRRDEMANLAWAIEVDIADAFGRAVDLRGAGGGAGRSLAHLRPHAELFYRLVPDLPETWAPMVPVRGEADARFLVLAGLLDEDGLDPPDPQGVLLNLARPLRLHEAELTRAGFSLERHWQLARWYDGTRHLWIGRRRQPGVGEIRSALEFDIVGAA
jgi:hypothetical protein